MPAERVDEPTIEDAGQKNFFYIADEYVEVSPSKSIVEIIMSESKEKS